MPCGLRLGVYVGYFSKKCPKNLGRFSQSFPPAGGRWILDRMVGSVAAGSFFLEQAPIGSSLDDDCIFEWPTTWVFSVKFLHFGAEKTKCRVSTQTTCPSQKVGLVPFLGWNFHSRSRTFEKTDGSKGFGPSRSTSLGPELLKDTSFGSENSWSSYMKDIGASLGSIFEKKKRKQKRGDLVECYLDGNLFFGCFWFMIFCLFVVVLANVGCCILSGLMLVVGWMLVVVGCFLLLQGNHKSHPKFGTPQWSSEVFGRLGNQPISSLWQS